MDAYPFYTPLDKEAGNDLPQTAGYKEGLDDADDASSTTMDGWVCGHAKGFMCLVHAVMRQPYAETGTDLTSFRACCCCYCYDS